jgi:hypothetical protein
LRDPRLPHVSPRWCGGVEQAHRVAPDIRREVRVPHRHFDRGVPQELLDCLQGHAPPDEVRGERMAEVVRCEPRRKATTRLQPMRHRARGQVKRSRHTWG